VLKGLAGEFVLLGLLAGLLAALAATALGAVLALKVFDLAWRFDAWLWIAGVAGGALGVGLAGVLGTRFVLNRPPMETLRAE
jgi:putative ABC transport system permease protein